MSFSKTWEPLKCNHQRKQCPDLPVSMRGQEPNFHKHQEANAGALITLTNLLPNIFQYFSPGFHRILFCVLNYLFPLMSVIPFFIFVFSFPLLVLLHIGNAWLLVYGNGLISIAANMVSLCSCFRFFTITGFFL